MMFFFMSLVSSVYGIDVEVTLIETLDTLYAPGKERLVICFDTFTYGDKKIGSDFSRYLENRLASAIQKTSQLTLFARNDIEKILETQELNLSDLTDEKNMPKIGALENVRGLLSGRFYDAGEHVELFLDLVDIETGTYFGNTSCHLEKKEIPKSVSLLPDNYDLAIDMIEQLDNIGESGDNKLRVKAWSRRGDGGTFSVGEDLIVHFYANADCYIKIYHINVEGDVKLIFPNEFHSDNRISKDTVYSIPDDSYGFSFELTQPIGTEFIKVVASTEQFGDIEESFRSLGLGSSNIVSRGLTVKQKKGRMAETLFSYTILEE
ncbi:MAG: DUF4384 domain-containing protein [Spirochaetales bacterium]|nr:DUF4384 domain-containing protein [Spirochaetales bacterium]